MNVGNFVGGQDDVPIPTSTSCSVMGLTEKMWGARDCTATYGYVCSMTGVYMMFKSFVVTHAGFLSL